MTETEVFPGGEALPGGDAADGDSALDTAAADVAAVVTCFEDGATDWADDDNGDDAAGCPAVADVRADSAEALPVLGLSAPPALETGRNTGSD
jgi:hypothetical protein